MEKVPLDRRDFLRLCVVAAGSAITAACQKALTETVALLPTPSVTLSLNGNQDVWAWVKKVNVSVSEGKCDSVTVQIEGQQFQAQPAGEVFTAEIPLAEGENQVSAACLQPGGEEVRSDPVIYTGRLRQVPTAVIQITLDGDQITLDGSKSSTAANNGSPIVDYLWSAREDNPTSLQLPDGQLSGKVSSRSISIISPEVDGEYYLSLRVVDETGREDTSTIYFVVENGKLRIPDYDYENPAWIETAVVYGVVPFLFGSPAFEAIRERMDDLADLGINAIWLGPINLHPADDYGYHVEDYFALDPAYGTEEDFHAMVQAAHERGIRVLMDFVPNHTSDTHPYFVDAQRRGPESPYWDFYNRDASGNPTHSLPQWTDLPDFNYDNPEVRRMIIEAFSYWVREFDVDGFRVDAAWAVKKRRPEFWLEWRRELKRIKPDLLLLAEASARDSYFFDNGFDVAYDWTDQPGGWAWDIVWTAANQHRLIGYNLSTALMNRPEGYHPDALIFRFINNNDTFKRFISRHGEAITRIATALLLTLPGVPCLFTGDEYGLEFEPYRQVEPLTFEEQYPGLRDYHKKLITLRKNIPSLHSRLMSLITPDAVPQTAFSFIRYDETGEAPILVLLNFSEEPAEFSFDIPAEFGMSSGDDLYDLLAEESVPAVAGGRIQVSVPALTARLLTNEPIQ
jgi:cyclomaltodextrinase / maltogenic alpha-amylase / neopullulanase